jgi:hypothetical protein
MSEQFCSASLILELTVDGGNAFLRDTQENVMLETQNMIPDTANRLRVAIEDLDILINDCSDFESSASELTTARQAVESASLTLRGEA